MLGSYRQAVAQRQVLFAGRLVAAPFTKTCRRTSTITRFANGKVNIDNIPPSAVPDAGDKLTAFADTLLMVYDAADKILHNPEGYVTAIEDDLAIMLQTQTDAFESGVQLSLATDAQKLSDAWYAAGLVNAIYFVVKGIEDKPKPDQDAVVASVKREVAKVIFGPDGTDKDMTDDNFWMPHLKSGWMDPVTYVALDTQRKRFILCVRGSVDISDWICDSIGRPYKPEDGNPFESIGHVHQGMYCAAQNIIIEMAKNLFAGKPEGKIFEAAFKDPEYQILVTGHSLGGGVCGLLSLLLNDFYEGCEGRVKGVCFAPAQVMDQQHAASTAKYIDTFVHSSDVVPRLSTKGIVALKANIDAPGSNSGNGNGNGNGRSSKAVADWWQELIKGGVQGFIKSKLPINPQLSFIMDKISPDIAIPLDQVNAKLRPTVSILREDLRDDDPDLSLQLYLPGTAHWILSKVLLDNNPYYPRGECGQWLTVDTNIYKVEDSNKFFGRLLVAAANPTPTTIANKDDINDYHYPLTATNDHSIRHYMWAIEAINNKPHWIETGLTGEDAKEYAYFKAHPDATNVPWSMEVMDAMGKAFKGFWGASKEKK